MERDQYSAGDDEYGTPTNNGFFGPDAVESAARVEPLPHAPRRMSADLDYTAAAGREVSDESGTWYLTPLAAFGAAVALAFGMFAGGNLLLKYGDQITALWSGRNYSPMVAERAFAGATLRPASPRPVHKPKTAETLPVEQQADFAESPEDFPAELPDEFFEDRQDRNDKRYEVSGVDRDKRFKDLEKIRERQQKNLKDFLDSIENSEDN